MLIINRRQKKTLVIAAGFAAVSMLNARPKNINFRSEMHQNQVPEQSKIQLESLHPA
jgi:hypothetical protein